MARGWESKSVEEQIEGAESRQPQAAAIQLTLVKQQLQRERESLELSRSRVVQELTFATHPRHRESLEAALKFLEGRIETLG
jgi:hypothetical protein